MSDKQGFLVVTQDAIFILLSIFYCIFGATFFRTQDTINSFYINNLINSAIGLLFIVIQFLKILKTVVQDVNIASSLFITYNLIPVLLLQKSMFGFLILFELVLVMYGSRYLIKTNEDNFLYATKERAIYGLIVIFFSSVFIGRGIKLLISYFNLMKMTNEIAVGISDSVICMVWLLVAILFLFNRKIGIRIIYSVIIQASLLFFTLVIYMIMYPIMYHDKIDITGLITIVVMSLFFIIPMILITKRKLTTAST